MFFDRSKMFWAALSILFFFTLVLSRLVYLQLIKGGEYSQFSDSYTFKEIPIRAARGNIFDRQGELLAGTRPSFNLFVDLKKVKNLNGLLEELGPILNIFPFELQERMAGSGAMRSFKPVLLGSDLSREMVSQIHMRKSLSKDESAQNDWEALDIRIEPERYYLHGEAFGHLLGYMREVSDEKLKQLDKEHPDRYSAGDLIGVQGIERRFDLELRGRDGKDDVVVDALGREVRDNLTGLEKELPRTEPIAGDSLRLTIDKQMQMTAYEALAGKEGSVAAILIPSGEVIVLASQPSYDPEKLGAHFTKAYWAFLNTDERKYLIHRATQAAYPPGSTFKIITGIAALAEGLVQPEDKVNCPGYYEYGGRRFGCWLRSGHGAVDFYRALIQSCDVYFYKMGERLGVNRIAHYARIFGLGAATGIELDFERSGLVPDTAWKLRVKKEEWNPGETLSVSIGQGYNLVTSLQSALMTARVASKLAITPTLVQHFQAPNGDVRTPEKLLTQKIELALDEKHWEAVHKALKGVVNDASGTARRSQLPGISVSGKTGTAQVVSYDKFGRKARSKKTEDHAWYVAYAPSDKPEIAVAVMVEHGGGGGKNAAPVAQVVLKKYFEIYHAYGKATSQPATDGKPAESQPKKEVDHHVN